MKVTIRKYSGDYTGPEWAILYQNRLVSKPYPTRELAQAFVRGWFEEHEMRKTGNIIHPKFYDTFHKRPTLDQLTRENDAIIEKARESVLRRRAADKATAFPFGWNTVGQ